MPLLYLSQVLMDPGAFSGETKSSNFGGYGWARILKMLSIGDAMWRFHERLRGGSKMDTLKSVGDIWLLGICYKVASEEVSTDSSSSDGYSAFLEDFSSRIWITYRRGFDAIGDSKYTSDVNWGCMIRSSQMLIAQALLFHHLGRSWRKPSQKPYNQDYIKILHLFGDSEACPFSIHNLIQAGKICGLSAGSWVGPYAMCRSWENLIQMRRKHSEGEGITECLPMAVYIVSGGDERGGAPIVCIDVASKLCADFTKDESAWPPVLLLVPVVLGPEKINPRYIPLLEKTFKFPQTLGIIGGKPATSTYIVGLHDDNALYLDPHEVQRTVHIASTDLEADTTSYHCSTIRQLSLDQMDSSLAMGFYCRTKEDFDDFCCRASELEKEANGTPLFSVTQSAHPQRTVHDRICLESFDNVADIGEEGWHIV